ncbi:hypothetical protein K474DRAFT_1254382 [Panus rudis PR-1116 ss-1]|nr:hypothetical protein K474DRAFT_1254382 [Panus rudis PR-1116 ss-1]
MPCSTRRPLAIHIPPESSLLSIEHAGIPPIPPVLPPLPALRSISTGPAIVMSSPPISTLKTFTIGDSCFPASTTIPSMRKIEDKIRKGRNNLKNIG